ncbi:hypothetical protein [Dactylosporangium sp. CA-092794]|uniref:hypothetical protein n=1 Tax=Dactylosporangium sp. CA-092794 TaxID=3239929 RepID=UPI003D8F89A7
MRRSRIGMLCATVTLAVVGGLPPATASAQPTPAPPTPEPTTSAPDHGHDMLSGVLHGEGLVQTKNGPIRVALQNGSATRLTSTQVTVRSSDGYTRTWQLPANLKVYDKRHTLQPNALQAGAELTVAGTAPANAGTASPGAVQYTAKWVVVRSSGGSPTGAPTGTAS